ncbi:MAG: nitroreductase [Alphaproteobacteria bacterium]|nr:nitroreductase [Alphaproteobacteria bacterium]
MPSPDAASVTVLDAIYRRRSVRNYTDQPIDRETIRALIDAAIHAPTAMHEEPWSFVIIQDRDILDRLSDAAKEVVRENAGAGHTPRDRDALEIVNSSDFHVFYNASALILICTKLQSPSSVADCWLAAENLMLAACAKGFGSCVIGFSIGALNLPKWKAELGIPEGTTVVAPIIVGYPAGETPVVARKPPDILSWK